MTDYTPLTVDVELRLRKAKGPISHTTIAKKDHMTEEQALEQLRLLESRGEAHEIKGGWVSGKGKNEK